MFKKLAIILVAVFGVLLAVPTMFPKTASHFPSWTHPFMHPISLGLDLKGGAQLLLEVDTTAMLEAKNKQLYDDVRGMLVELAQREEKPISGYRNLKVVNGVVSFDLLNSSDASIIKGKFRSVFGTSVDIDFSGKVAELRYSEKQKQEMVQDALARSIEIVRRRIDALGTKEPSIQSQGGKYILVQLPGVDNPERIKELIGQTAKMTFHLVNENISPEDIASGIEAPAGTVFLPYMESENGKIAVYTRVEVSGETLKDSQSDFNQNNMPVVTTVFDSVGARKFAKLTREHVNERFAIVLDDKVLSAPVINEPIPGGRGQISGNFTPQSAKDLAVMLRSGALPAPLQVIEERTVGAGLGADTIANGKVGSVIGIALVLFFMILMYRTFGLIADIVLLVNLSMIIGVSALMGATLTLPGIAGIVLTLGMAVDANILPFERIRDEIREGSSTLRAVDFGFNRSMKTVLDGELTNLICALILFQFGAGPIRGFAVTLSIGVLTTLFTCLWLSRVLIDWYMGGKNKKIGYVRKK